MENPHDERQAILLERVVKSTDKCTELILEVNKSIEEIIRYNTSVRVAAELATKYRKNVQYNLAAAQGNDASAAADT